MPNYFECNTYHIVFDKWHSMTVFKRKKDRAITLGIYKTDKLGKRSGVVM